MPLPLNPALVLASGSPRRKEILTNLGFAFQIVPSDADESLDGISPDLAAQTLAGRKALAVSKIHPHARVLGYDTLVYADSAILGKPQNEEDAFRMLSLLNGKAHEVRTGVALCVSGKLKYNCQEVTKVFFRELSEAELWDYIRTGEPMDKAGAYGAQKYGARLIRKVEGCFFNVVGLPIEKTMEALALPV